MTIPHSNAGEERIFSLINKNNTPTRSSLQIDGTLSSLIIIKTHIDNPLKWEPSLKRRSMLQRNIIISINHDIVIFIYVYRTKY